MSLANILFACSKLNVLILQNNTLNIFFFLRLSQDFADGFHAKTIRVNKDNLKTFLQYAWALIKQLYHIKNEKNEKEFYF